MLRTHPAMIRTTLVMLAVASFGSMPAHAAGHASASAASLARRIDALEQRATRAADFNAVAKLQRAFGYYLDKGYWDEAADLFADDATMEVGVDGVYVGKAHIRARLVTEGGGNPGPGLPYGQLNTRMQLQPVIHVAADGRTAQGRWREIALLGHFHVDAEWGTGTYENTYVKDGGVWKIAHLHYFPNFVAPYDGGWAKLAPAGSDWRSAVAKSLPADRPPTLRYQVFPEIFTPPFHYLPQLRGTPGGAPAPSDWAAAGTARATASGERAPGSESRELAALDAEVDRAAHDLAIVNSRQAIEDLQAAYGYFIDKGLWHEAAALFARDATYEYGQQGVYVGRARIEQALALMGPAHLSTGQLNDYPMLQPIIDVAPDNRTAQGRWRSDVMLAREGHGWWGGGVYENGYANEGGVWRIASLHYFVTFFADYDKGWGSGLIPMERASRTLPPDRPPSLVYTSLPTPNVVAYHYGNPVSAAEPSIERPVRGTSLTDDLAALEARANALAHRVELLKDQAQIEKIQRAYGYYVDKAQWPDIAALFAPQGTYEIGGRGIFIGPKRVLEYLVTGLGPVGIATRHGQLLDHQQFEGIVDVGADGRTAHGRWTALIMGGAANGSALWGDATYENSYVKLDGVWHAASFRAPFTMYASYKGGWRDSAVPNTRPDSFAPPPDLPPSTVYLTYPSFYAAPFHYANPVTGRVAPPPNPAAGGTAPMHAADPPDVIIDGKAVYPESITSGGDGTLYLGSLAGTIYRALPGSARAQPWISRSAANGLLTVFGVLADERSHVLWVCSSPAALPGGVAKGHASLMRFDLASGARLAAYPLPAPKAICDDIAIASDGTAYVADIGAGQILRLAPGGASLMVFATDPALAGIDGIAFAADGALYVDNVRTSQLLRVERARDGSFDGLTPLILSQPIEGPDGLRPIADGRFVLTEARSGRIDEVTVSGVRAQVRVLGSGLQSPSSATVVGETVYALEGKIEYLIDPKLRGSSPEPFVVRAIPLR